MSVLGFSEHVSFTLRVSPAAEKSQYGTAAERSAAAAAAAALGGAISGPGAASTAAATQLLKKRTYEQANGSVDGPMPKRPALGVIRQAGPAARNPATGMVSPSAVLLPPRVGTGWGRALLLESGGRTLHFLAASLAPGDRKFCGELQTFATRRQGT